MNFILCELYLNFKLNKIIKQMGFVTVEKWNNIGGDSYAATISYIRLEHKNISHFYVCPILFSVLYFI